MLKINVHIDDATRSEIKNAYGNAGYGAVNSVVADILHRYLNAQYFDPNLKPVIEDGDDYEVCGFCGEKAKHSRMVDVDGTNLEERDVCDNCGSGYPEFNSPEE